MGLEDGLYMVIDVVTHSTERGEFSEPGYRFVVRKLAPRESASTITHLGAPSYEVCGHTFMWAHARPSRAV